jgi:hypothetical protein
LRAKATITEEALANLHISQERSGIAGLNEESWRIGDEFQRMNEESEKVIKWVPQDKPRNFVDG